MTFEFIKDTIQKHNPQRIIFFGGEPLLELELIEQVLKEYHGKIKFQIVTSTSVNFKEFILDIHSKYPLNEIQLSWDGFNNNNRVDICGNNIQNKVYDNILWAIENNVKFDIKCVIGNENVHLMKDIHDKFIELKQYKVSGEFVIAHRDLYTDNFYKCLEENLLYTFSLNKLYREYLNKIIAYLQKDRNFNSCDIGKYTVITPDGYESICTALSQERVYFDPNKSQERCKHIDCQNCEIGFLCDGGCRYERYNKFKDEWQYNYLESTCKVNRIIYNTIKDFVNSLDNKSKQFLISEIFRYKDFTNNYFRGL